MRGSPSWMRGQAGIIQQQSGGRGTESGIRSRVRTRPRWVSSDQKRYWNSRQGKGSGHKRESATGFQEQASQTNQDRTPKQTLNQVKGKMSSQSLSNVLESFKVLNKPLSTKVSSHVHAVPKQVCLAPRASMWNCPPLPLLMHAIDYHVSIPHPQPLLPTPCPGPVCTLILVNTLMLTQTSRCVHGPYSMHRPMDSTTHMHGVLGTDIKLDFLTQVDAMTFSETMLDVEVIC